MELSKLQNNKMLIKEQCAAFLEDILKKEDISDECEMICSKFFEKHGDIMEKSTFFILLLVLVQESKEVLAKQIDRLSGMFENCEDAFWTLKSIGEDANGLERYHKLLENEEIQDYSEGDSWYNDREHRLFYNRENRILSLARDYWEGKINRDELIKKVNNWNMRKCESQQRIEIGHVFWEIADHYKNVHFPLTCENLEGGDV